MSKKNKPRRRRKTALSKKRSLSLKAIGLASAFAVASGAAGAWAIDSFNSSMSTSESATALLSGGNGNAQNLPAAEPVQEVERDFYILLLGVDASDERRGGGDERQGFVEAQGGEFRADSITLAHVNLDTDNITLCSFDRDLKSIITGFDDEGYRKLNAAYELGGSSAMKAEVEELTGVEIPYVAVIDMTALETLVDSLGGIDVDIEEAFWDEQLQDGFSEAGVQHLNGQQALLYSRARHAFADGTVSRARHQRQILQALGAKLRQSDLAGLYSSVSGVSGQIATNLTFPQLYEIGAELRGMDWDEDVHMMQSPTIGCLDGEVWYSFIVRDDWKAMVAQLKANDGKEASSKAAGKVKMTTDAVYADETVYFPGYTSAGA